MNSGSRSYENIESPGNDCGTVIQDSLPGRLRPLRLRAIQRRTRSGQQILRPIELLDESHRRQRENRRRHIRIDDMPFRLALFTRLFETL